MNVTPVLDHPVLRVFEDESILCAGDLHIGLEDEMASKGIHMPSQTARMEEELIALSEGSDRLVLLGDVKHQVPGTSEQEYSELPSFFQALKRVYPDIDIAKGNHDVGIEDMEFTGVHIHPATGFRIGEVGFVHGHVWPSNQVMACRILIMAHNHPAVLFRDGVGNNMTERCWLRAKFKETALSHYNEVPEELIVVPSLNPTLQGSPINLDPGKLLGPLLSKDMIDLEEANVYLLDGIHLGTIRNIMVKRPRKYSRYGPGNGGKQGRKG